MATRLLPFGQMQACPGCGTTTAESGLFCPSCGAGFKKKPKVPIVSTTIGIANARAAAKGTPQHQTAAATPAASDPAVAETRAGSDRAAASLVGTTIGDFVIEGVIGGGSFGTVYRGRQVGLDRPVAIKVPTHEIAADPVQARRFAREARAAARVVHPGVVAIYAVGELPDGRPYLAMQRIDGEPLDRILADGPIPPVRALKIIRAIASALSETHAADVVHRDLKPSNIMWRRDRNGDDRITLVDFGIAVCRPGNADVTRLTSGGLIGTPHYMSPEQAQGELVDARADLYALGCVLFELVTGDPPFEGSGFEVLLAHLGRPLPRPSERKPGLPPALDDLVLQLMQKKPDARPASADELVARIDETIADIESGAPPARSTRPSRPRVKRPTAPTTNDLPNARGSSRRLIVYLTAGLFVLAGAGFTAFKLRGPAATVAGDDKIEEPEPTTNTQGKPVSATGEPLRMIARDDGELIVNALVPETIHANVPVHTHLEIKTKLGAGFAAREVVVTIEDPQHHATATRAQLHGDQAGHYVFQHVFPAPGTYIVRIFPSETETVSEIDLDVVN